MARLGHARASQATAAHRSQAPHGPKARDEAVPGAHSHAGILQLQRAAGNQAVAGLLDRGRPVQRLKDGFDVKLAKSNLKLADQFQFKHVATDAAGAQKATDDRYQTGKMPRDMQRGILPNTVAPAETWIDALDASDTKVETKARRKGADKPDKDDWTFGIPMKVGKAWQVRWNPRSATYSVAEVSSVPLAAGGYPESVTKGKRSQEVVGGKFLLDHISGA